MTYRRFHAIFTVPLAALLGLTAYVRSMDPSVAITIAGLSVVVVGFTFPWDQWAVKRRIWEFPKDRVWFRIGALPVEEISFFVLQTIIVGLLVSLLLQDRVDATLAVEHDLYSAWLLQAALLSIAVASIVWFSRKWRKKHLSIAYAWHLLVWFIPVLAAQWIIGYQIFLPRLDAILIASLSVGTYLVVADLIAVQRGIWFFDPKQITGFHLFSVLPWEEVAFFLITSLLVAQSVVLLLPEHVR